MTELLTAAQMRAIEQAAITSGEVTGLELMERAGRGVVEAIFEEWPDLRATLHRAVVLCGPGNNGGDGFVVARLLKEWGGEVEVFLYGDPDKLPPDARVNYERWREMGAVRPITALSVEAKCELLVDAIFGTGLTRPIEADLYDVFDGILDCIECERRVSVDVPSGMCADSGRGLDFADARALPALRSGLTVTFHLPRVGHFLDFAQDLCGKIVIKSIGIPHLTPAERLRRGEVVEWPPDDRVILIESGDFVEVEVMRLYKDSGNHKYTHGHALILSGGPGKGGAARLTARGALRIGAGLVTVACPAEALAEHAAQLNAVMLRPITEITDLVETLSDDRINAVCLGPGLGLDDDARTQVTAVLAAERATVLDADALTDYADDPSTLFDQLHEACVLTPHAREFARLFPDIAEKLNAPATKGPAYSKVDATREAAARAGCVVLFKGPDTVIAAPDGRCSINSAQYDRAAPWLATAGSGDVLAGFITGLLARGFSPMTAAETGAWLHVEAARKFGPGLIAEDLPEQLPAVFRDLGL
ncbi:MAG: NAD(P)H-hydrate dehydratase [Paracoccaceae bacterium]